jgi:hypothetical protein
MSALDDHTFFRHPGESRDNASFRLQSEVSLAPAFAGVTV